MSMGKLRTGRAAITFVVLAAVLIALAATLGPAPQLILSEATTPLGEDRAAGSGKGLRFSSTAQGANAITVPGAVRDITVTEGDGHVRLEWNAPVSDGSAEVDHYVVFMNGEEVVRSNTTSIVISGLVNGETYRFMVAAHNSAGMGPLTMTYVATPKAESNPLSVIAPVATIGAIAVVIVREVRLDLIRRTSRREERKRLR